MAAADRDVEGSRPMTCATDPGKVAMHDTASFDPSQ
jgi:hypothetical protein